MNQQQGVPRRPVGAGAPRSGQRQGIVSHRRHRGSEAISTARHAAAGRRHALSDGRERRISRRSCTCWRCNPSTQRVQWTTHVGTYQFDPLQQKRTRRSSRRCCCRAPGCMSTPMPADWSNWPPTPARSVGPTTIRPKCHSSRTFWWGWDDEEPEASFGPSGPLVAGGQLFIKGMQSPRLFALRPDGSALDWKRSVPQTAMLAGIDDERVYLASEELLAFDLKTQKLLWANNLPVKSASIRAAGDRASLLPVHAARDLRIR